MKSVCFLFLASIVCGSALGGPPLPHDGFIRLYHSHTHEFLEVYYEMKGQLEPQAFQKINHFMRSRDSGKEKTIDINLIFLLDHIHDHFGVDSVEIVSGYRSPEFNRYLKSIGRNVSDNSFHLQGMAADFHLDEITEKKVRKYLNRVWSGGVGYYPDNLMLHVDTGPYRRWQQGKPTNHRDIGIFNNQTKITLATDKLFYRKGQKIKLSLVNFEKRPLQPKLILEHFFRGQWKKVFELENQTFSSEIRLTLNPHTFPYGKMRWKVLTEDDQWQNSNEFYLKKI